MRSTLITLTIVLCTTNCYAQVDAKVYKNISTFKNNSPELAPLTLELNANLGTLGDFDCIFYGSNRE